VVPGVTGAHILVVDDLADMRDLLAGTLVAQGYRVQVADRAEVALKAARRSVPDLIVSDWMMPGQTGPQMVEELRQDARLEHVPVILLTARSGAESKLEATLCGADAFLGKPFDEAELLAQVHNLLRLKAREHEVTALNQRLVEQVLTRCLPPALLEGVLSGETSFSQSPELRQVTVLSARLEGFELQLRSLPAERSGTMLNDYLDLVSRMAFDHQGTLAHFAADRINVLFGAPEPLPEDAALRAALRCAADMQERIGSLAEGWVHGGLGRATLCIGVHSGEALVGTFGSELRAEYTAIGPAVAMAEKLAQVASPGSVTMTSDSADGLPSGISSKAGQLVLQGEADPIPLACLSAGAAGLLAEASRRTGSD